MVSIHRPGVPTYEELLMPVGDEELLGGGDGGGDGGGIGGGDCGCEGAGKGAISPPPGEANSSAHMPTKMESTVNTTTPSACTS